MQLVVKPGVKSIKLRDIIILDLTGINGCGRSSSFLSVFVEDKGGLFLSESEPSELNKIKILASKALVITFFDGIYLMHLDGKRIEVK